MDTRELVKFLWVNRDNVRKLNEVGMGTQDAKTYFKLFAAFIPAH